MPRSLCLVFKDFTDDVTFSFCRFIDYFQRISGINGGVFGRFGGGCQARRQRLCRAERPAQGGGHLWRLDRLRLHSGRRQGDVFFLVTDRPAEKSFNVVSVIAGYTYKDASEPTVMIDKKVFTLFTRADRAWTHDDKTDKAITDAMRRGTTMIVKGSSSRGTPTSWNARNRRRNRPCRHASRAWPDQPGI